MRSISCIAGMALVVVAPVAAAANTCPRAVQWTSDTQLTLAVVEHGRIAPSAGQCTDPFGSGLEFQAIDRWGKPTGVVRFDYDATRGDILTTVSGTDGAHVYVRPTPAIASAEWTPDEATRRALDRTLGSRGGTSREITFFRSRSSARHAVVTDARGVAVFTLGRGGWARVFRTSTHHQRATVRAIVDMNGDGSPEIIFHVDDYEVVLGKVRGRWQRIADNEDTA